jgi:hypothetical protein
VPDADTVLALARTYPGPNADSHEAKIRALINDDCGGTVTKVEDARGTASLTVASRRP